MSVFIEKDTKIFTLTINPDNDAPTISGQPSTSVYQDNDYSFTPTANDIDDERLMYKSFGSTQPLHKIPEKNEKERNENRRVEILILEN